MLSPRQHEVLELIRLGSSNKEIADRLGLTTGTVKQHVHALFRKLGVTNRTMAAARAAALAVSGAARQELHYSRRLVTVVVIEPRPGAARTSHEAAEINRRIDLMRERVGRLAFAFDARAEPLAAGAIAAWFGQPLAHGDDAERAIAFVRLLAGGAATGSPLECAVGIATAPELVGEGEHGASAYHRAFRHAMRLAALAQPAAPLACAQTAGLALLAAGEDDVPGAPPGTVRIGAPAAPDAGVARRWGGLPFLAEAVRALRERRCQWLAVESWPPEAGTRLMDAIGACLAAARVPLTRLWMPVPSGGHAVAQQLAWQLGHYGLGVDDPDYLPLADMLARRALRGPAACLVHGIDALNALARALGPRGVERLRSLPLLIVAGAMQRSGTPQTVVRLFGQDPLSTPFAEVHRLQPPPEDGALPDGIRPDVQAVLDALSAEARAAARLAAHIASTEVAALALALGVSEREALARCRELESWGLLHEQGGQVSFRDEATAAAVRASLT